MKYICSVACDGERCVGCPHNKPHVYVLTTCDSGCVDDKKGMDDSRCIQICDDEFIKESEFEI